MPLEQLKTSIKTKNERSEPRPTIDALWRGVLGKLYLDLSEYMYKTWAEKCFPIKLTENSLEIACPQKYTMDQVKKFESLIQASVNEIGKGDYKLIFTVDASLANKVETSKKKQQKSPEKPLFNNSTQLKGIKTNNSEANLAAQFTFDNYIMGDTNRLAYSIAWAIAEDPGKEYNPLFLYSGVGLGKTHLVQAIGNKILKEKPNLKILYTTGEQFCNELIEALQSSKGKIYRVDQFRKKFRNADVLIIDDIQFIVGKESTQQEFFHTFNTLHLSGKQIVLTSDRPPKDFVNLEKRITSRFGSGITADIQHPTIEMRTAILRNKRDANNEPVPDNVIDFIAEKVDTNIRELKGAYIQVASKAKSEGKLATMEMAGKALGQIVVEKRETANTNTIMKAVCKYFSVNKTDIKGKRRTQGIVIPRQIAMYLLRQMTDTPLVSIGELLGGRDHTTIMHGVEKIAGEVQKKPRVRQDIENIKSLIQTL